MSVWSGSSEKSPNKYCAPAMARRVPAVMLVDVVEEPWWKRRLTSRTAFGTACSKLALANEWPAQLQRESGPRGPRGAAGEVEIVMPQDVQTAILEGLRKFYPRESPKYAVIKEGCGVVWSLDATRLTGCYSIVGASGERTTVSTRCPPKRARNELIKACRGSILQDIYACKSTWGTNTHQVDHCNEGGFQRLCETWLALTGKTDDDLMAYVLWRHPHSQEAVTNGFTSFREPLLSEWREFHRCNAQLQEITVGEHKDVTKARRALTRTAAQVYEFAGV